MTKNLDLFFHIAKLDALLSRKIPLGGLGFSDFVILSHLDRAEGKKLRRIDLAEKTGFTPSGITRLLLPMEKIGLVGREPNPTDARVSYVTLAPGGATLLADARERAEFFAAETVGVAAESDLDRTLALLADAGGRIAWNA
jgi:DNA-binding MarR family transcriptional regulator